MFLNRCLELGKINQGLLFRFLAVVFRRFWNRAPGTHFVMQSTSNGCKRDLMLVAGCSCRDMTKEVNGDRERLSLFCLEF